MRADYVLAGLRIYLGCIFALAVYPKLQAGSSFANMLTGFLTHVALQNATPWYQSFVTSIILPHVALFALMIKIAESAVALALISGTATRLAGVIAMFLVTNYMLSKGLWWWNPSSNDGAFFVIALVLVLTAAGRTLGVDAKLAQRRPLSILW